MSSVESHTEMRLVFAVWIAVLICLGPSCGSTPTRPTAPPEVSGRWTGRVTITSVTAAGAGACYAQVYSSEVGVATDFDMTMVQGGGTVSANTSTGSCKWVGSITGDQLSLALAGGSCADSRGFVCSDGSSGLITLGMSQFTGTISGSQFSGSHSQTETITTGFVGSPVIGSVTVTSSFSLFRN
jgi:hypothetical protein